MSYVSAGVTSAAVQHDTSVSTWFQDDHDGNGNTLLTVTVAMLHDLQAHKHCTGHFNQ